MFKSFLCAVCVASLMSSSLPAMGQDIVTPSSYKKIPLKKSVHALNIIYFLGNDVEPVADYERRISELMIYLQQFYGKEMLRNGFGSRSFGMKMKSPERVNLIVYKAKEPASFYPYDNGGGGKAINELNSYFKENPQLKTSNHMLIIMPTWNDEKNNAKNPGGVPFYGMGRNCFALDYPDFELKHLGQQTPEGKLLTKWYGGLAHELGHGLNLPHNHATSSASKELGIALMGAGNYSFGLSPTFITPASAAILDTCEVFSFDPAQKYYTGRSPVETSETPVTFEGNHIIVKGTYKCDKVVRALTVYVQDPPYQVNRDYDAITFAERLGKKQGEFKMSINRDELTGLENNKLQVTLLFLLENGEHVSKNFEFEHDNLPNTKKTTPIH